MKTFKAQLLTIVFSHFIADRLTHELKALGVSGYTTMRVDGFGTTGARTYGLTDGANIRLETIVSTDLCEQIMERLSTNFQGAALVAHHHEVSAIPVTHFGPSQ